MGRTEIACACCACVKLAILRLEMDRVGKQDRFDGSRSDRRRLRNSMLEGTRPHDAIFSFVNAGSGRQFGTKPHGSSKARSWGKGWPHRKSGLLVAGYCTSVVVISLSKP